MTTGTIKKSKKHAIPRRAKVMRRIFNQQKKSVLDFFMKRKATNTTDAAVVGAPVAVVDAAPVVASPAKELPKRPMCNKCYKLSIGIKNKKNMMIIVPKECFQKTTNTKNTDFKNQTKRSE